MPDRNFEIGKRLAVALLPARVGAALLGLFGLLGLSLALVGIYGVISYQGAQRTGEIGLRMALGKQRRDILRLVVGQGLKLTLAGIGIGAAVSLVLTRFLSSLLVGVSPVDPLTFVTLILLLSLFRCRLATYRHGARRKWMMALRHE